MTCHLCQKSTLHWNDSRNILVVTLPYSINNQPNHLQACIISLSVSPTPFHPSLTLEQLPICTSNFVSPFHGPFFPVSPLLVPPGHLPSAATFMEPLLLHVHDHEIALYICALQVIISLAPGYTCIHVALWMPIRVYGSILAGLQGPIHSLPTISPLHCIATPSLPSCIISVVMHATVILQSLFFALTNNSNIPNIHPCIHSASMCLSYSPQMYWCGVDWGHTCSGSLHNVLLSFIFPYTFAVPLPLTTVSHIQVHVPHIDIVM